VDRFARIENFPIKNICCGRTKGKIFGMISLSRICDNFEQFIDLLYSNCIFVQNCHNFCFLKFH